MISVGVLITSYLHFGQGESNVKNAREETIFVLAVLLSKARGIDDSHSDNVRMP